ncbi:hypothetical protein QTG54_008934 [Skeletonema marinoi]|uniref:Sel1 repeat family protein n=1 Tax=Skeletonema marinoi TaxID=267567 RepID=A0AAD8Y6L9_9STRA|nr:hypothetical protein QTG54_008934 [Skeletonema marinoi]
MMKRVEANDPVAIYEMGVFRYEEGDYEGAFEYLTKGAELGDAGAHYLLSIMYDIGHGVEEDENKRVHHLEEAAIGGHPDARHNLSSFELRNGRMDRAVKHAIIAANLGHDISLGFLKSAYKVGGLVGGLISKDDFAATLRAHQAAVDATKSAQREEAEAGRRVM